MGRSLRPLRVFSPALAVGSLLAATAAAQSTLVLPVSHRAAEGASFTGFPFGRSAPMRVQTVYAERLPPGLVTFSALALRGDQGTAAAAKPADVEIALSHYTGSLAGLATTFAANRGQDHATYFSARTVTLPALASGAGPRPFDVRFQLDRPFVFDPGAGALLVELVVSDQAPGGYAVDACWLCTSAQASFGGPACGAGGGKTLKADSATTQVTWGRPLVLRVFDGAPANVSLLFLGTREGGSWLGFTLPFDLSGAGAAGCWLSTDPMVVLAATADSAGSATFTFPVPAEPLLLGAWFRFQGSSWAPTANPLGLVFSSGHKVQVCGWEHVARLYQTNVTAPDGQKDLGLAPVLELTRM
jgi:hypothetical protein